MGRHPVADRGPWRCSRFDPDRRLHGLHGSPTGPRRPALRPQTARTRAQRRAETVCEGRDGFCGPTAREGAATARRDVGGSAPAVLSRVQGRSGAPSAALDVPLGCVPEASPRPRSSKIGHNGRPSHIRAAHSWAAIGDCLRPGADPLLASLLQVSPGPPRRRRWASAC